VLAADQDPWELWDPATRAVVLSFHLLVSATSDVLVSGDPAMAVGVDDRQTNTFSFGLAFRITRSGAATVIWNGDLVTLVAHDSGTAAMWRLDGRVATFAL
jgi:hypothetical protein